MPAHRIATGTAIARKLAPILTICARAAPDSTYYFVVPELTLHPAWWAGRGMGVAGLHGTVEQPALDSVLAGRDPATGALFPRLSPMVDRRRHVGYDAEFSAPKSISLLAMTGSEPVQRQVRNAHRSAVEAGFDFLDAQASALRRYSGGRCRFVQSSGFAGAGFTHATSRSLDPHLHTHTVFANLARGEDGQWSAFSSAFVWASARTAGYVYAAVLRHEVTRRLGLAWEPVRNGVAELSGFPRDVLSSFSSRGTEVRAYLREQGLDPRTASFRQSQYANLRTRVAKPEGADLGSLADEWRERADRLGFGPDRMVELLGHARVPEVPERARNLAEVRLARNRAVGLSEWTLNRAAVRVACEVLPPAVDPRRIFEVAGYARSALLVRQVRSFARDRGTERSLSLMM